MLARRLLDFDGAQFELWTPACSHLPVVPQYCRGVLGKHIVHCRLVVLAIGVALSACSIQRSIVASEAPDKMIGLPKEQVLACMGAPTNKAAVGATEV